MLLRSSRNNVLKRALCSLVLCLYLAGFCPQGVFSGLGEAEAAPRGAAWDGVTSADPVWDADDNCYVISDPEQLAGFRDWINASKSMDQTYRLAADIDLGGRDWTPIGIGDGSLPPAIKYFSGVFDGDGHEVSGMRIVSDDYSWLFAGLFGYVSGDVSELKNVGVMDFDVSVDKRSGFLYVGGLVGRLDNADITSSHADGELAASFSYAYVGGLVGYVRSSGVTSSHWAGSIVSSSSNGGRVGGLVGSLYNGSITSSYSAGSVALNVAESSTPLGGLVGEISSGSDIASSYSTASVIFFYSGSAASYAGGFVGYNFGSIESSYSTGDVEAISTTRPERLRAGGFAGYLSDGNAAITTSYAWGAVSVDVDAGAARGGLVGHADAGVSADKVKNNNWRRDSIAGGVNDDLDDGIGDNRAGIALLDAKSHDVTGFAIENIGYFRDTQGWDFENIWCYSRTNGGERPDLRAFVDASDILDPASARSADIRAISADIGGKVYTWQQQNDETTWLRENVPADADLSNVDLNVELWPGASVDGTTGLDLNESVEITVTAPDGRTTKTYTVTTYREEGPEVVTKILDAMPENARAVLTLQADGKYAVDIYIPFDTSYDPSQIASIYVDADNISIVRVHWLDEDGNETEIPLRQAGGHELHIEGTVANRHTLADVTINKIIVRLYNDGTRYTQELNMNLSKIPGGIPDDPHTSGGGVGCVTGAGMLALVGLGLCAMRRRKV